MIGLYHNEGNGLYVDEAPGLDGRPGQLLTLTFGIFFFDYDLDGRLDIFAGNGHVADDIAAVQPKRHPRPGAARVPQPGNRHFEAGRGPARPRPGASRWWRAGPRTGTSTTTATSTWW